MKIFFNQKIKIDPVALCPTNVSYNQRYSNSPKVVIPKDSYIAATSRFIRCLSNEKQ